MRSVCNILYRAYYVVSIKLLVNKALLQKNRSFLILGVFLSNRVSVMVLFYNDYFLTTCVFVIIANPSELGPQAQAKNPLDVIIYFVGWIHDQHRRRSEI